MNNDIFVFTIRRRLLGDLLRRMEKIECDHAFFGLQYFMIDPWPAEPVRVWSLTAYADYGNEAPCFIESIPIIRATGGTDHERVVIVPYRYGLLCDIRALWEQINSTAAVLDLTVRVRDDVRENTLQPIRLEPSSMIADNGA